jgi:hypothetical protein
VTASIWHHLTNIRSYAETAYIAAAYAHGAETSLRTTGLRRDRRSRPGAVPEWPLG